MAVFPLENGVFSGTLLRFNVRGYVYIWSLIFSMFNFFVGALRFMRARRVLVCIYCTFIWGMGKWEIRGMGRWVIKWINWGKREYKRGV